jgi:Zn-finger nucleic acid-binding protein
VMTYGAHNVTFDIRRNAVEHDGTPTCVAGLRLLRDELTKIIDEYTKPRECPTCHQRVK